MKKEIAIGSDHAGYRMKEYLKEKLLKDYGFEVKDYGTYSEDSTDYPDYAHPVAQGIENGLYDRAIVVCSSGNGVNMTVNKYPSVRSALCWNTEITKYARLHNDANILALPGSYIELEESGKILEVFLNTEFEGGRHKRRIDKIRRKKNI